MEVVKQTDSWESMQFALPQRIADAIRQSHPPDELVEVALDIGRPAYVRYFDASDNICSIFCESPKDNTTESPPNQLMVTKEDIQFVVDAVKGFDQENRASLEGSLHRISAILSRRGDVVGITFRIGRTISGLLKAIEDILEDAVEHRKSILLLGKPGMGKTSVLRELSRVLSDQHNLRVVVVDTANEIAGDGDIPHPAIGSARRMQVQQDRRQHSVMLEAVQNHTPDVVIVDEVTLPLRESNLTSFRSEPKKKPIHATPLQEEE